MAAWVRGRRIGAGVATCAVALIATATAQVQYSRGQNVVPVFEGWEPNPDGSYNLLFGYMNRNYEERLHIPLGPNNTLEPGGQDQGQPTYFLPRRNRHVFRLRVAKDFGKKELVWTLTANGRTERAYATLNPDYVLDRQVLYRNNTGIDPVTETENNKPPLVSVEDGQRRTIAVGESLVLTAVASDDGIPPPTPMPRREVGFRSALGLRVAWFVYRGAGDSVTFEPAQFKPYPDHLRGSPWTPGWAPPPLPQDGKFPTRVTFSAPGSYVLRVQAHDGGADGTQDVAVEVRPSAANPTPSSSVR